MKVIHSVVCLSLCLLLCSCAMQPHEAAKLYAVYAEEGEIDFDSAIWKAAPVHMLTPRNFSAFTREFHIRSGMTERVLESGSVRLLWNEKALYVRCDAEDSDLADESEADQTALFAVADTIEVFLHQRSDFGYYEIFGSVGGRKTSYYFPGRGRLSMPGNNHCRLPELQVNSRLCGTLNRWQDRDSGFSILIRIPAETLGAKWGDENAWSILVARWNYSRYLPACEISVTGNFPSSNPHVYEEYAELVFCKPAEYERNLP
ncbi:sugar-binding protein [Victivallis vadensis]|jgi:domain of unknown function (DUF1083)|uniref:sugar-binding protein n=1 Tax=Victivallis vadensis TaxID=172901 RepID=UPI003CFD3B81|nr:hypothetical protein [bacterium]